MNQTTFAQLRFDCPSNPRFHLFLIVLALAHVVAGSRAQPDEPFTLLLQCLNRT